MITDDKSLSPFGQQIAEDIAMSEITDRFEELVSNYKDCSDLIYKKYHLMDLKIKKEETDTEKIILTQGDLDLYFLIKRFALGMMGANLHHLHEMCLKYSSFCDRVAAYTRLEQPKDKSEEE